jgi:copper chaperone CopZ
MVKLFDMKTQESSGKWAGTGLLVAITASLCCTTPVLALLAGTSGIAATFSFLEPARPYLIGLTIAVLGFAWYQKLKPVKAEEIDCDCEEDGKPSFWQSKPFLGIVTAFALIMLAFPNYAHIFYPDNSKAEVMIIKEADTETVTLGVSGMTCTGCEEHVKHAVKELPGVIEVEASYEAANTTVKFDKTKSSLEDVKAAINSTGYKVKEDQIGESTSK